jgi:hypothetical protein
METFRKYFFIILLAVIIAIVWGGVLLYSKQNFSTINPNAEQYTKPLSPKFDETILNDVSERIISGYAIPPESFFEMTTREE